MRTRFQNLELFNGQAPQWLVGCVRAQLRVRELAGPALMNLDVRRAELFQVCLEVIAPSVDDRGRVRMDDDSVLEAVDGQPGDAVGVAVKEAIRRQVRPLRQRRSPTDGVSDRTRPGD
jgi:hypothetical protein